MPKHILAIAVVFLATTNAAQAENRTIKGLTGINHLSGVAHIRKIVTLVNSDKTIKWCVESDCLKRNSELLVNIVEFDNGPSTDVSPPRSLYLTMYNSVEETGIATSYHLIDDIYEFKSTKRTAAGIYEVTYRAFRPEEKCRAPIMKAKIDARVLSATVRAAKKVVELESNNYTGNIFVKYRQLSCPPLK